MSIVQRIRRILLLAFVLWAAAGCALVTRGTQQNIRIETVSGEGKALDTPACSPQDGKLAGPAAPTQALLVKRSYDDLLIRCIADGQVVAAARVVSRADMALVSLVIGGVTSAVVDQLTGAAYAYPAWIRLVAGEERIYDQKDSADGPTAGIFSKSLLRQPTPLPGGNAGPPDPLRVWYRADFTVPPAHLLQPGARPTGRDTYNAEKLAATLGCSAAPRAVLVERGGGFELHRVACSTGATLMVRCEFGNCRAEPVTATAATAVTAMLRAPNSP